MQYLITNSINDALWDAFRQLMDKCDGYEPYYTRTPDDAIIQCILTDDSLLHPRMYGFVGLLISPDNVELSGMVAPDMRRRGCFKRMTAMCISHLKENYRNLRVTAPFDSDMAGCSLCGEYAFSESLYRLSRAEYITLKRTCSTHICSAGGKMAYTDMPCTDSSHADTQCPDIQCADMPCTNTSHALDINYAVYEYDGESYCMYLPDYDEPVATLGLDRQKTFANVYGVYVADNLRGRGIGTQLMMHFLREYFDDDANDTLPLVLNVTSTNAAAVALYQKCGFTEVSRINYYYVC